MTVKTKNMAAPQRSKAPLWWRVIRGTVRGTGKVAHIVYVETRFAYGVTKTRTRARYRAWKAERTFTADDQPEIDEVPIKRRRRFRTQYLCFACNRKYRSAYGLNKHHQQVHANEPKLAQQPEPMKIRGHHATGKVRVRPPAASGTNKTTTKTRSANPMDSVIARALKTAWGHMSEARPRKLSEIRNDMVGLEQALTAYAGEAINEYRAHLVRNVGFDPVTVQRLTTAIAQLEEAGKSFSAVIATIDEVYAADIAAARKRKGGMRPSDETLTG